MRIFNKQRSLINKLSVSISRVHQMPDGYIASLNVARFIACFFIVIGHVAPFYVSVNYPGNQYIAAFAYAFVHVRRMGIVFFLLSSGYLFGRSLQKGKPLILRYIQAFKRLIVIFFFWSIFYYIVAPLNDTHLMKDMVTYGLLKSYYWYFLKIAKQPLLLIISGTKYHLWFIPSLMVSISLLTVFILFKKDRYLPVIAIIFYLLTIFLFQAPKSWVQDYVYYRYLRAYCSGFVFVVCGWWFSQQTVFFMKDALKLFILALFVQTIQDISLWYLYRLKPDSFTSIGLLPAIFGIFIIIMCNPNLGKNTTFERWGKMTLGVYLLHPFILDFLQFLNKKVGLNAVARDLTFPVIIVVVCIYLTKFLSQNIQLKKIIS